MRVRLLACVPTLALATGCSANVVSSAEADAESSPAAAVIVVERMSGDNARSEAVARFVRGRTGALDEQALRWMGMEPELPAPGSCARVASDVPTMPAAGVRLLDVGRVTLSVDARDPSREGGSMELVRRRVPDVVDVVSGVVYTGNRMDLPSRGAFEVRVNGEPELGAVRVQAEFAGEPAQVRVLGQDATGVVALPLDTPVDLTWDAASDRDLVYVDVTTNDADRGARERPVTRCTFNDTGRALLASSVFGETEGTMTVHRMHRSGFRAAGIDRGELRLDFAREISFARARR